ncbi:MAG: hypothetical protein ACREDE_07995, partial [Thermoplasmata archaeon]
PLALPVERLAAVRVAAVSVANRPGAHFFEDFAIFHGPSSGAMLKELLRGKLWNLRYRWGRVRP